jgi:hypothetical protein
MALKMMRLICGFRQIDVWAATGIPVNRLSLAERGRLRLSESEERLLAGFLLDQWGALRQKQQFRVEDAVACWPSGSER